MTQQPYFSPNMFRFLRQLKKNNRREWFAENKERYLRDVRDPLLRFISDFAPRLAKISPYFRADPRPMGGSMFRIYRDTRFSKDKSPYKLAASAQFRHEDAKDVHAPGFYLHLEPSNIFVGTGLWHPDSKTLTKIRDEIVEDPKRWKRILTRASFKKNWALGGDALRNPPRGYDPSHPLIEDLKRKDFVAMTSVEEEKVCRRDFLRLFTSACKQASPLVEFLTRAVGLKF